MTVSANVQKLEDGPRNLVVHLTADVSADDQEFYVKKVDVTTLSTLKPSLTKSTPTYLSMERIDWVTANLWVSLYWEVSVGAHQRFFVISPNEALSHNFRLLRPINNNAVNRTGNVLLSTATALIDPTTVPPADGAYAVTIWFRKRYE